MTERCNLINIKKQKAREFAEKPHVEHVGFFENLDQSVIVKMASHLVSLLVVKADATSLAEALKFVR